MSKTDKKTPSADNTDKIENVDNNEQTGQAQQQDGPIYTIDCQYLKDSSFENPNAPDSLKNDLPPPTVDIDVDVVPRRLDQTTFEVLIKATATGKNPSESGKQDLIRFIVEMSYGGAIRFLRDVSDETLTAVLFLDAPRVMFPFLRQMIAEVTVGGGYPPLMINPIDFLALYRRKMEEAAKANRQSAENGNGESNGQANGKADHDATDDRNGKGDS
ncbi:MAG: protein-export chaperone SecB [Pseudomonadota bacterium]